MKALSPLEVGGKRERNSYSAKFKLKVVVALKTYSLNEICEALGKRNSIRHFFELDRRMI